MKSETISIDDDAECLEYQQWITVEDTGSNQLQEGLSNLFVSDHSAIE